MDRTTRMLRLSVLFAAGLALGTACADGEDVERSDALDERIEEQTGRSVGPGAATEPSDEYEEGRPDRIGGLETAPDVAAGPDLGGASDAGGFEDRRREVSVVAVEIGDRVLLVPSAILVAEGTHSLRVHNEGTTDRAFLIEGLPTQRTIRIPAGQAAMVQLDGLEPGSLYSVVLSDASDPLASGLESPTTTADPTTPDQLEPERDAHATLIVLPGRRGPSRSLVP